MCFLLPRIEAFTLIGLTLKPPPFNRVTFTAAGVLLAGFIFFRKAFTALALRRFDPARFALALRCAFVITYRSLPPGFRNPRR